MPPKAKQIHLCTRCYKSFSRAANLRRHQQARKKLCEIDERVGTFSVRDPTTGKLQPEAKEERVERIKRRKRSYYCRNVVALRLRARLASHRRRGARQGTVPKKERIQVDRLKWRRIIRAVHWRGIGEIAIFVRALDLARYHSPGDKDVPQAAKEMYKQMKKIFAHHPGYWDASRNTWDEANFNYEDSCGDPFSDLERIYAASAFDSEEDRDDDW